MSVVTLQVTDFPHLYPSISLIPQAIDRPFGTFCPMKARLPQDWKSCYSRQKQLHIGEESVWKTRDVPEICRQSLDGSCIFVFRPTRPECSFTPETSNTSGIESESFVAICQNTLPKIYQQSYWTNCPPVEPPPFNFLALLYPWLRCSYWRRS